MASIGKEDLNFFHFQCEISKQINKNVINVMNFIRLNKNFDDTKEMKVIIENVQKLSAFSIGNPDIYLNGFHRLVNNNVKYYIKYLIDFKKKLGIWRK